MKNEFVENFYKMNGKTDLIFLGYKVGWIGF